MLSTLKKGLSKLLIPYHPLAGEVVTSPAGEPEIHCNNHGVEFIEAYADIELCNLALHHPDAYLAGKLLPMRPTAVLCLQVNRRLTAYFMAKGVNAHPVPLRAVHERYGRMIHSCIQDHRVSDGYSAMASLQAIDSSNGSKKTKFEAFSGCLWKAVAKSVSGGEACKLGVLVDGRLTLIDDVRSKDAMAIYYGNVVSLPYSELDANELTTKPLSWPADQVHDFLRSIVTPGHFQGFVDWIEAQRPHMILPTSLYKGTMGGPSFAIPYGRLFHSNKLDFGWGRPILGSCYFPRCMDSGYVMPMPSPATNGDWVVYMHLCKHQLDIAAAELRDVLHPLNFALLKLHEQ
ncbi:coniferyl alcohol acyltransferase-like [Nymphaea colorata]|nr:coniferyl alcohol acyltransferase-like [Nymphaea colorata]